MQLSFKSLLAGAALLATSLSAFADPTEITDALGRKVMVELPVKRVAVNFNFEEFTAVAGVDGWSRVVGISRAPWEGWRPVIFNRYKAVIPNLATMPDIGHSDDNSFSAEKVIGLKPDVLLMSEWGHKALSTQMQQIEAAGIPVVIIDYNAQLLERHLASTRALGKVMGAEGRAEGLASLYERQYKDVLARVEKAKAAGAEPKKVYVELGQAGAETIGNTYNNTMWGKIITTLGAQNIAAGKIPGPWGPLNAEAVIAENPDIILMASSSWVNRPKAVRTGYDISETETRASLMPYAQRPGWADLKAIKAGEINAIEHGLARTLYDFVAMQYIGKRLYPEAFADVDPVRSFRDYHESYLPVAFSGTWMLPLKP
ncbi:iron siderophore ABC transporter substrate-binding protein [Bosea sp. AAP35]|uniref:ABC transporter substrate-binding protein n=1 Tax=Bosea sp. AAP35 TaxID=1523417 RepID=UPI0006B961F7|nr:ABC transporter substrate-binding protein [Bosea sp. AAP35]KPF71698.1 iron siderophore ABC transporter substrate-binding protein [Bosea sp. AAP35]